MDSGLKAAPGRQGTGSGVAARTPTHEGALCLQSPERLLGMPGPRGHPMV